MRTARPGNVQSHDTGISQSIAAGDRYLGAEYDNSEHQCDRALVDLTCQAGVAPSAGGTVSLYVIYAGLDDTYEDGSDTVTPIKPCSLMMSIPEDTASHRQCYLLEDLQPRKFKLLVANGTDASVTVAVDVELYNLGVK